MVLHWGTEQDNTIHALIGLSLEMRRQAVNKETQQLVSGSLGTVEETVPLGRAVREGLLEKVTSGPRLDE